MKDLILTDVEFNQLAYIDQAIKNMKTPKQKLAIELKEKELADKRVDKEIAKIEAERKRKPKTITLHNRKVVLESELTEEIIDKEIEFWFNY